MPQLQDVGLVGNQVRALFSMTHTHIRSHSGSISPKYYLLVMIFYVSPTVYVSSPLSTYPYKLGSFLFVSHLPTPE